MAGRAPFASVLLPLLVGTLAFSCADADRGDLPEGETDSTRVLIFSRTAAFRHGSIEAGIGALEALAAEHGVTLDDTEDPAVFAPESLAVFAAVIFLSTTGDVLDDAQQEAFTSYIRGGGGFVGIHAASDTEYEWPWYGQLVGGYFDGHPGNPNVREGTVLVAQPDHPATAGLPATWVRSDEWYDIRDFQTDVTVLLNVDESTYKRPEEGPAARPRPIAWARVFDGGRMFYTALGHTDESYGEPEFLSHVWGGLEWVLGVESRLER